MCIILLFYIILCFSLFFPLMGAWLCHANIVQRVKSCYKIKIDYRVLDCCFYGVTLCKQHPSLTIAPLLHSNSSTIIIQQRHFYTLIVPLLSYNSGKRIRDAAFFLIIMLVTFAATLLKPQNYVSSRTIQKCVEHVSTST